MIIETKNLTKKYKEHTTLNNVSLNIPRGEIYGLIGENGAGKTTLLKLLTGQILPTYGEMKLFSSDQKSAGYRVGSLIENPGIYPRMSARDNLKYKCICLGIHDDHVPEQLLEMVGLGNTGKKATKDFSMGMKQRLGIALALVGNPDLLLLDEPINGMDPQGIVEFRKLFKRLNEDYGMTIVISSHMLDELSRSASSFGILKQGQLITEFTREELEERTRNHLEIISNEVSAIAALLEENMDIHQYQLVEDNTLLLHEGLDKVEEIAKMLFDERILVTGYQLKKASLEDYFLKLTGGYDA